MSYRLGVDVGGTFIDLLLINEETGATFRVKVPTTPANQAAAVLDGIERVCASAGIKPSALTELMHGTTATTNAVLEGKGARVGLVTPKVIARFFRWRAHTCRAVLRDGSSGPSPSRSRRSMTRWKFASGSARAARSCANWMKRARARRSGSSSGARSRPLPYR
jgi:hypothetical protein